MLIVLSYFATKIQNILYITKFFGKNYFRVVVFHLVIHIFQPAPILSVALLRYGAYSISKIAIISAGVTTIGVCGKCFLFPVTR